MEIIAAGSAFQGIVFGCDPLHNKPTMQRSACQRFILLFVLVSLVSVLAGCKWEQKGELSRNREK
jgi:hypothetical protein